jgi:hypothetical protein
VFSPGTELRSEHVQCGLDQVYATDLKSPFGEVFVPGTALRSEYVQCSLDQDDATDLRIHLSRCLVQGLRFVLSTCNAVWIRMMTKG